MTFQYHSMTATKENMRLRKEQKELDRTPIRADRRPYLRTIQDGDVYKGLLIGDQRDTSRCFKDKRVAQSAYKQQLSDDILRNNVQHGSPVNRPQSSGINNEYFTSGLIIGRDETAEKEERRIAARSLMEKSRIDIDDKIEVVTKQQEQLRRQEVPGEFFIGADEDAVRAMKKEEKKKYFALLSADNRAPHAPHAPIGAPSGGNHVQGPLQSRIKVQDPSLSKSKVLSGLLIGGYSLDSSKSTQNLHIKEKKAKQKVYNLALHDQQEYNAKIKEDKEYLANLNFDSSTVPYMRIQDH